MMKYRSAALALAACAASLSVAACSSGASSSAASSSTAGASSTPTAVASGSSGVTSSAPPTTGPAIASKTIKITGALGSFMVPAAAKVAENTAGGQSIVIVFGEVTPADVARFYA